MSQTPGYRRTAIAGWVISCLLLATACAQNAPVAHRVQGGQTGPPNLHMILDPIMEQAVADGQIPGGVLLVGHDGRVIYRKAFGNRSLEPTREPMTEDMIFD